MPIPHAVCASAVEAELLTKNPCHIKRARSTNRKREPVLLSVAELARVADAIRPERFRVLVLLSAWAAMRFGEVSELRRKDISDGCETITVSRAVTHRSGNDPASRCRDTPKSGKTRTVVSAPHTRTDVKHHLDTTFRRFRVLPPCVQTVPPRIRYIRHGLPVVRAVQRRRNGQGVSGTPQRFRKSTEGCRMA
jgi:integrase